MESIFNKMEFRFNSIDSSLKEINPEMKQQRLKLDNIFMISLLEADIIEEKNNPEIKDHLKSQYEEIQKNLLKK